MGTEQGMPWRTEALISIDRAETLRRMIIEHSLRKDMNR